MKLFAKLVLGVLAYRFVKNDLRQGDSLHVGRRSAGRIDPPLNNGGL